LPVRCNLLFLILGHGCQSEEKLFAGFWPARGKHPQAALWERSTLETDRNKEQKTDIMKLLNRIHTLVAGGGLALALVALTSTALAEDKKTEKPKPYPLDKCIVTDEKLGEMGKPFVFTHEGQEIKLCCKSCQKDFKKAPAKYLKKLEGAGKADKK
jgi:hypothetical protein